MREKARPLSRRPLVTEPAEVTTQRKKPPATEPVEVIKVNAKLKPVTKPAEVTVPVEVTELAEVISKAETGH